MSFKKGHAQIDVLLIGFIWIEILQMRYYSKLQTLYPVIPAKAGIQD